MKAVLKLPKLSMNMEEAVLTEWHKAEGEAFSQGDILYSVETEKVLSEVEAPCDGVLLTIMAEAGSELEVGAPVCRIEQR
ncbi:lipoyl domain-containing protein [Aquibium sp. A9E412]|uniref:lipoyl domain-containing protein n=1 Tax=Aquibium sp. A9E412 TaxID=2976767 RepID=UPI0025B24263|nr:lipoyl domain-containing protein [Aquibium sp. A9E412]MDN2567603.1 lipoyl domain-containing protein [Aquibium sp. A9E412]